MSAPTFPPVSYVSPDNGLSYLNPNVVTATRQTDPPRSGQTRSGYGARLPSSWMLQIHNRWYRVRVMCWSNSGTPYVTVHGNRLLLGSYDPGLAK